MDSKKHSKSEMMQEENSKRSIANTDRLLNRLFFIIIPVLLGLTLTFSIYTTGQSNKLIQQAVGQNARLEDISNSQKKALDITQKDIADSRNTLLCIGLFFNRTDRGNLQIVSYVPCIIINVDTGERSELKFTSSAQGNTGVQTQGSPQTDLNSRTVDPSSPNDMPTPSPAQSETSQNILEEITNGTIRLLKGIGL